MAIGQEGRVHAHEPENSDGDVTVSPSKPRRGFRQDLALDAQLALPKQRRRTNASRSAVAKPGGSYQPKPLPKPKPPMPLPQPQPPQFHCASEYSCAANDC